MAPVPPVRMQAARRALQVELNTIAVVRLLSTVISGLHSYMRKYEGASAGVHRLTKPKMDCVPV